MASEHALTLGGYLLAFATAGTAVLFDAYTNLAQRLLRAPPGVIVVHPAILALCGLCGAVACVAYGLTDPTRTDVVSTALTLKAQNPLLRGLAVGATVLILFRSKLFNIQDSGFGGEAIYTLLRSLAIQAVNDYSTRQRDRFLDLNIDAAFLLPNCFFRLQQTIDRSIESRSPEYQNRVRDRIAAVIPTAPKSQMSRNDPDWENYYRSYSGICFDYCGPKILSTFPSFRMR
jgi:hypothetical protein